MREKRRNEKFYLPSARWFFFATFFVNGVLINFLLAFLWRRILLLFFFGIRLGDLIDCIIFLFFLGRRVLVIRRSKRKCGLTFGLDLDLESRLELLKALLPWSLAWRRDFTKKYLFGSFGNELIHFNRRLLQEYVHFTWLLCLKMSIELHVFEDLESNQFFTLKFDEIIEFGSLQLNCGRRKMFQDFHHIIQFRTLELIKASNQNGIGTSPTKGRSHLRQFSHPSFCQCYQSLLLFWNQKLLRKLCTLLHHLQRVILMHQLN